MIPSRCFTPFLVAAFAAASLAQGRIVVAHDDATLSNSGFAQAPTTGVFVQDVAAWFTGGRPGNFRAWSTSLASQTSLANAMTSAGHTWTVSTAGTFDLATLQQYDGVFVVGTPIDKAVLAQYVQAGGNVFVAAGTGANDQSKLNPFLANFDLSVGGPNGFDEVYPISSSHPIFAGVASLYHSNGNSVSTIGPRAQVLVTKSGRGLYGAYDGHTGTPATNTTLGAGCDGLAAAANSRPILGTSWDLAITGIPATGAIGLEIFGLSDAGFDELDFLGMPGCGLRASLDVVNAFSVAGSSHAYALAIPNAPSLIGMSVFTTGAVFLDPPTNPFGAITANGLRGSLGDV